MVLPEVVGFKLVGRLSLCSQSVVIQPIVTMTTMIFRGRRAMVMLLFICGCKRLSKLMQLFMLELMEPWSGCPENL